MSQRSRRTRLLIGLLVTPVIGLGLVSAPATASSVPGGTVKGTVTVAGEPLAGAKVTLVRRDGDSGDAYSPYTSVTTNSAGRYTLTRPRGSSTTWWYDHVVVSDPKGRAATDYRQFMGNKSSTVTRNVTLKPAASITGKVTRADGADPRAIRVEIVDGPDTMLIENLFMSSYDDDRGVNASGTYRFIGLPAGAYTLCYRDPSSTYLDECYDEVVRQGAPDAPTPVSVAAGATATLKDQVLDHRPARVRGKVTSTSGEPIVGIIVRAVRVDSSGASYASTTTRSSGRFDLAAAGADQVQVKFENSRWETRWYDSRLRSGAQVFALTEGTTINDLDVELRSAAELRTKVKPGTGKATFTVEAIRRATGYHPGGKVTVSRQGVTRTVTLTRGVATMTLKGLPAGTRTFHVDYTGSSSTADAHTTVKAKIG